MSYATLMVNLADGQSNAALLAFTGDLAARFHASVLGIATCQPMQPVARMGAGRRDLGLLMRMGRCSFVSH